MESGDGLVTEFDDFFNSVYSSEIALLKSNFPKDRSLNIKYTDLEKWNSDIADLLLKNPDKVINAAKEALEMHGFDKTYDYEVHVRFHELPDFNIMVQDLGAAHIDKLIRVEGILTKRYETKPKVKMALFKCQNCGANYKVIMTKQTQPMRMCEVCKKKVDFSEEESYFVDVQFAEMQELLERLRGGAPASHIQLMMEDDLVNYINPGEEVTITGILRIKPPLKTQNDNIYLKYLDVLKIDKSKKDFEQLEITEEEKDTIKELAKEPDILAKLARSFAPGIFGNDRIKEAITLQLFGGTPNKTLPGGAPIRDDMHLLLIGDPGAAKSRLLHYVHSVSPKSVYVSGKSVSGVGLTASAEKDNMSDGGWVLKAGALVLASGGLAAIDEFDKIDDSDRASLHEAMESQRISVAKAGIVATFKSKTAIIAAANPKYGRFNKNQYPADQFNIPTTLLSRFDLIFPMFDDIDEDRDRQLATHILNSHANIHNETKDQEVLLEVDFIRKYISYARKYVFPRLTPEAMTLISDYYIEMRNMGKKQGSIPITARQIEGLVRMAEASAKARLCEHVESQDAERSIRLFDYALKLIAMDATTGKLDIDIITTGQPKARREKFMTIINIIKELSEKVDLIGTDDIKSRAREFEIEENEIQPILDKLREKGEIYSPKNGFYKITDRK